MLLHGSSWIKQTWEWWKMQWQLTYEILVVYKLIRPLQLKFWRDWFAKVLYWRFLYISNMVHVTVYSYLYTVVHVIRDFHARKIEPEVVSATIGGVLQQTWRHRSSFWPRFCTDELLKFFVNYLIVQNYSSLFIWLEFGIPVAKFGVFRDFDPEM
jgi:hypothetical protein